MKLNLLSNAAKVMAMVVALCMVPQKSDAQIINGLVKGAKMIKSAKAKSQYEPLKEKAEAAVQNKDIAYLMSEECMVELPAQGDKLEGNAQAGWNELQQKILGVLYVELHTIDKAGFCENVEALIGKASAAEETQMKALYIDAAIGVMKSMITNNYDVASNRAKVDAAYKTIKAEWDKLPDSYKPYAVPENANIRDPRYLHNLKGGIPDADFIIAYQEKIKAQQAEAQAKKEAAAAAEAANKKNLFAKGNPSICQFYVSVQKEGVSNLERVDIANIGSGSTSFNINEKNGTSSIGKFVFENNEWKVYRGSSVVGYISENWEFFDKDHYKLGSLSLSGQAYDKNNYTLGEISSQTVKYGSSKYVWNATSSISNKLFPAALFLFFNNEFANYINIKDHMAH